MDRLANGQFSYTDCLCPSQRRELPLLAISELASISRKLERVWSSATSREVSQHLKDENANDSGSCTPTPLHTIVNSFAGMCGVKWASSQIILAHKYFILVSNGMGGLALPDCTINIGIKEKRGRMVMLD